MFEMETLAQELQSELSLSTRKLGTRRLQLHDNDTEKTEESQSEYEQIVSLRRIIKDKSQQLLAQTGELSMYEAQNRDLRDQLSNTTKKLKEAKRVKESVFDCNQHHQRHQQSKALFATSPKACVQPSTNTTQYSKSFIS